MQRASQNDRVESKAEVSSTSSEILPGPHVSPQVKGEPISRSTPTSSKSSEHLLNLVELMDEIASLKAVDDGRGALEIVEARLNDLIELADGEVIRDTEWKPDRQRAVKVEPSIQDTPTLLSSRRSGLIVNGRIIRKQEVVLSQPETK